mgnify:CR=1 FL=1
MIKYLIGFVIGYIFGVILEKILARIQIKKEDDNIIKEDKEESFLKKWVDASCKEIYYCKRCGKSIGYYKSFSEMCDDCFYDCYID